MPSTESLVGKLLTCNETGKQFVGAIEGCSTNYARDNAGNIYSDEGVNIREKRELLDRSKPFGCYMSSDGQHLTGWKGNVLATIVSKNKIRLTRLSYTHGSYIYTFRARDVHGKMWYGRGNAGICCTIRAYKD